MPRVPFTFERLSALTGPNEAEVASVYWAKYEFGGRTVEVYSGKAEDAADVYQDRLAAVRTTKAEVFDVRRQSSTASTIGRRVDEGAGMAPRHNGGIVLMFFILRKDDRYVQVRADGERQPLAQPVQDAVSSIVTSMRFP